MKSRLTITLPNGLLQQIDELVDKQTIRNRSHAIEHLIRQSLTPQITTALILAGGKNHHGVHPVLKDVHGEVLLTLLLRQLHEYGITHCIVCAADDEHEIEKVYGAGTSLGLSIEYSYETEPLGTAGALRNAQSLLKTDNPFLVIHGDILTDINLDEVFSYHLEEGALATIIVKPQLGKKEYGQVAIQGSRITTFSDTGSSSGVSIINTGVYVLEKEVLSLIPRGKHSNLETELFPSLAKKNQLRAYFFQGFWYDISSPSHYKEAVSNWSKHH